MVAPEDRDLIYTTFYDVLNDLMARPNLDIYVTGSNSRMLSKDIATNFRDRGVEIRLHPLSFAEYYPVSGKEKADAWEDYLVYGGMPLAVLEQEASAIIRSLRGHVSIVLWCGGNELFNSWSGMTDQSLALRLLNKLCYELDR